MRFALRRGALLLLLGLASCTTTRVYVVRHAEKAGGSADPSLTPAGAGRAQQLAERLKDKHITRIFVSDFKRTQETAAPTAARFGIEPTVIPGRDTDRLIDELKQIRGENTLVVRHSNEIHVIVNALAPADKIKPIDETEYDNLFIVEQQEFFGRVNFKVRRERYGQLSTPPRSMQPPTNTSGQAAQTTGT